MHVHLRRAGAVTFLAAAAAVVPASCATNDSSIFVVGCVQVARDTCTAELSTTTVINFEGLIDAAFVKDYNCLLMVENQMVPEGNQTTQRTETSGVQLTDAEVQVFDPSAGPTAAPLAQFSVPITGYIPPGAGGQAGIGGTQVVLVDPATIASSPGHDQQLVVASVILHGNTLGGLSIATGEFRYPITISEGSSCYVPAGSSCVTSNATAVADCRLGLDEPSGTNCQLIASIGVCGTLECTLVGGKSDIASAHCPVHIPPDNSCCTP
jgi:hypothetical protein